MKKGDRPNPGEEFLYHLAGKRGFQQDLAQVRKQLGIPLNGFPGQVAFKGWLKKADMFSLLAVELQFHKKYKISIAYQQQLDDYLFFGRVLKSYKPVPVVIDRCAHRKNSFGNIEELYREIDEPYAKLLVLGSASKSDVLSFIDSNWKHIDEALVEQRGERKTIRKTTHKERNLLIKKLFQEPTKALQQKAGSSSTYKDTLIQKIMTKRGYKMSEGQIRKLRYK